MIHQGSDFLTEAVMNSFEASASEIVIACTVLPAFVDITVKDDGEGLKCTDAFGDGVSTKGDERGMGLYLLKMAAEEASIGSDETGTLLSFRMKRENMGSLTEVLPFIFSFSDRGVSVTFSIRRGSEVFTLDSRSLRDELGELCRVGAISEMRKRSRVADELLKES